ncbi:MAG: phenylalanine--tRNA ligase subunit beta [Dehalococcoidia bacterium]|nr:phenylalanine--tRNA ligase subunit beta [Dehalococcoidia bacterium]
MKVSLKWLRDYVEVSLLPEELAAKLTASGNEVATLIRTGGDWDHVHVAHVTAVEPHPNADRLRLATVDTGGEVHTVVCGAPNLAAGQRVAYASIGAHLLDGHNGEAMELKAARIRGVVSEGMICSERELGLSDQHEGILVLPETAPLGAALRDYLSDVVFDIDVTPNRPDCYSVVGVAREVAVLTGKQAREPDSRYPETALPIAESARVQIDDPDLCLRYTASLVTGVKIGPSPAWMQQRLAAAGMRPINNVVDVTNYVMLEVGQPLHAFDFDTVRGRRIVVRRAKAGETMATLDGVARTFTANTLLICDAEGPVGVAGIIGGASSEVSASTTTILLEAANFDHINIRQSETSLRVVTEASRRFDKGLHPHSAEVGLRRATKLLVELCGGTAAQGIIDEYPTRRTIPAIEVTQRRLTTVLGATLSAGVVYDVLTALGCTLVGEWEPGFRVTPPWWRPDLRIQDDFAEELARIIGYDELPTTAVRGSIPHAAPNPLRELKEQSRDVLVALGMQEVINYSLVSLANLQKLAPLPAVSSVTPLKVANPMSNEQEYLRTTLRPSVLLNLAHNQRSARGPIRLFEAGRIYLPRADDLPEERDQITGLMAGPVSEMSWTEPGHPSDFFDCKGVIESWLHELNAPAEFRPASDPNLMPGRTAEIVAGGEVVGVMGELHPDVAARFDIESRPVYLFELDLAALLPHLGAGRRFSPIARFQAVTEDLALVVSLDVEAADIAAAIRSGRLVTAARLFDIYTGEGVPAGKKSLAFQVTYQSPTHTLTNEEVAAARSELLARLAADMGAQLR